MTVWNTINRIPMPLQECLGDSTAYISPRVLLSNAAGEYVVGWAELAGPWEQLGDQIVGRDGAEVIWCTESCNDFTPDLWAKLPKRPDGKAMWGAVTGLSSVMTEIKSLAQRQPARSD